MVQKAIISIIIFFLAIAQVSFLPNLFPEKEMPNLMLILLIFWTARKGIEKMWVPAILGGLFLDILSFFIIGTNLFVFVCVMLIINYLARSFLVTHQTWRFFILIIIVVIGTFLGEFILLFSAKTVFVLETINNGTFPFFDTALAGRTAYSVLLFIILYWPLKKLETVINLYGLRINLKSNAK
jgi:rod shape-determining protein MreD